MTDTIRFFALLLVLLLVLCGVKENKKQSSRWLRAITIILLFDHRWTKPNGWRSPMAIGGHPIFISFLCQYFLLTRNQDTADNGMALVIVFGRRFHLIECDIVLVSIERSRLGADAFGSLFDLDFSHLHFSYFKKMKSPLKCETCHLMGRSMKVVETSPWSPIRSHWLALNHSE